MKLRSVTYLSKEGVKNLWANRLMTIASVGVLTACMVLIGLAILISLNLNQALGNLQQQNVIRAFFNDKTSMIYGNASEDYVPKTETSSEETSSLVSSSSSFCAFATVATSWSSSNRIRRTPCVLRPI